MAVNETETIETKSGAKSSKGAPKYHLLSRPAILGLVQHLTNGTTGNGGAARYGEGNWEKGAADADFLQDRLNHMFEHMWEVVENPRMSHNDLLIHWRGVMCNAMFILHSIETHQFPQELNYKGKKDK